MHEPDFTLSAGPTMSSLRVQQAQGRPMIFDYDPVFQERFRETERLVAELFQTTKDVVLMQGEAVLGIEAAARGVVTPGLKCLNLVSGVYAKWFGAWLRDYGAEVVEVEVPYDEALDPAQVREELERHGDFALVALVHSETPSGVENPLAEIGPMAKDAGALVFADVVSAVGGTELLTDEWGVDIAIGGPQKCLAGPPGMSLCVISEDAWAAIERNPNAPRGSFLSLLDWREIWIKGGRVKYPYTPSVSDINGVHAAVGECLDDGLDEVIARHATAARACREGVKAMGLELWPRSEDYAAHCVTAIRCPEGAEVKPTLAHIRERYGVMLSGGYGELTERLFRLGHMGPGARSLYPVVAVSAFGRGLLDLGPRRRRRSGCRRRGDAGGALGEARGGRYVTRLPPFERHRPASVEEATELLEHYGDDAIAYVGGTEVFLLYKLGFADYAHVIDLKGIDELRGIERRDGVLRIGAAETHRAIERHETVRADWPALAEMERAVGNLRVRTMGSIGGNLCFADPHSDPATFLLALDAALEARRGGGEPRRIEIAEFVSGPFENVLEEGELLTGVLVPEPTPGAAIVHRKFVLHERPAITVACHLRRDGDRLADVRLAVGSAGVRAARARRRRSSSPAPRSASSTTRSSERARWSPTPPSRSRTRTARSSTSVTSSGCSPAVRCERRSLRHRGVPPRASREAAPRGARGADQVDRVGALVEPEADGLRRLVVGADHRQSRARRSAFAGSCGIPPFALASSSASTSSA